jgi:Xaa-Pro aminopeptidase
MRFRSLPPALRAALLLALLAPLAPVATARGQVAPAEYAERRAALAKGLADGVILVLGAPEPERDYENFSQSPRFHYLTGYREPGATLVMVKRGGDVGATLFVEPKDPAREVWSGMRHGAEGATRLTGIPARSATELATALDSLLAGGGTLHVVGEVGERSDILTVDAQRVRRLVAARQNVKVAYANERVDLLRGRKSAAELELIRKAVAITVDAQREAMRAIEPGMNEFEIQALVEYTFRRNGADRPGFATIIGSGPNSTTLHYNADDRFMTAEDVVVMDIGASYRGYSADVTRTVPVSGRFSDAQKDIYRIVREAQAAAERQAKPGAPARAMTDSSSAVLRAGLARLGLIEGPGATYDCDAGGRQCPQLSLYYMHGLGHGIGLEVHDPEQYYVTGRIAEGSAFTLEPGIYVRANLLEILPDTPRNRELKGRIGAAVRKYAGIGVRIEDDYVVSAQGLEWLSRAPREIEEIEALMAERFAGPAARDAAKVEWYRAQPR